MVLDGTVLLSSNDVESVSVLSYRGILRLALSNRPRLRPNRFPFVRDVRWSRSTDTICLREIESVDILSQHWHTGEWKDYKFQNSGVSKSSSTHCFIVLKSNFPFISVSADQYKKINVKCIKVLQGLNVRTLWYNLLILWKLGNNYFH